MDVEEDVTIAGKEKAELLSAFFGLTIKDRQLSLRFSAP